VSEIKFERGGAGKSFSNVSENFYEVVLLPIIASLCDDEYFWTGLTYLVRRDSRHSEYAGAKGCHEEGDGCSSFYGWTR